jgi:hypothetical protein
MDENMFEIGSIFRQSHVFFESEADGYFSKTLTAKVQSILSYYWSVLAAAFAGPSAFTVFPDFLRFYFGQNVPILQFHRRSRHSCPA